MNLNIFLALILLLCCMQASCEQWYEVGNPHFLDSSTVSPAIKDTQSIKIVKFFSPWCKYCRYIKTYMDNYKNSHNMSQNLKFYEINCQGNAAMFCFTQFQVRAFPAVIIIDEKGDRVSRIDGLYPQDTINAILEQFNNKAKNLATRIQEQKNNQKTEKQKQESAKVEAGQNEQKKNNQNAVPQVKQQQKKQQQVKKQEQNVNVQKKPEQNEKKQQIKTQEKHENAQSQKKQLNKQQQKKQHTDTGVQNKLEIKQTQKVKQPQPEAHKKMQNVEKQQNKNKEEVVKVEKSMVTEQGAEKAVKIDPLNIQSENKYLEKPKQQGGSYQFVKYLFYLIGISVGVLYGIKIFCQRRQVEARPLATSKNTPSTVVRSKQENQQKNTKIATRDLQKQILVEQVMDQNL